MKKFYNYLTDTQSDNTFKSPLNLCVPQNLFFYCLELMHNLSSFFYFSTGFKELESHYLVPGDVFLLDGKKLSLPCDAVLIDGSCIVNEGMLTGTALELGMLTPCAGSLPGRCLYLF